MSKLFSPLQIREVKFRNRIFVSPMCQYSAVDGVPNNWHLVHLGSRAVGGAGLVMAEATAVSAIGRISPGDLGLWNDIQLNAFIPIAKFIKEMGAVPGIQLAHAGRKASTHVTWRGGGNLDRSDGGWNTIAPSAIEFSDRYSIPAEMTDDDLEIVKQEFISSAKLAITAGFEVIEIHSAHGYLLHQFLSPLSNYRNDEFGGTFVNRMRYPLDIISSVRENIPDSVPLFVRISATDWTEGGWI